MKKFSVWVNPTFPEQSHYHDYILEKSRNDLSILERAINENWTLKELMDKYPGELIVYLEDNCSGVNVANLTNMTVSEWTW